MRSTPDSSAPLVKKPVRSKQGPVGSATYQWLGMDETSVGLDLDRHFHLTLGRDQSSNTHHYLFNAAALTVRDRLVERWRATRVRYMEERPKRVAYLSL